MASINRLSPILAIAVGVLHAGLAPVLVGSDVKPNIALVAVVLVTCWSGARAGATWAFVAGLTVNLLSAQPLGSVPLSLLAAASLTAGGVRLGATLGPVYPVAAVTLGSIVVDAAMLLTQRLPGVALPGPIPADVIAIGAVLNGGLAAAVLSAGLLMRRERPGVRRAGRWTA